MEGQTTRLSANWWCFQNTPVFTNINWPNNVSTIQSMHAGANRKLDVYIYTLLCNETDGQSGLRLGKAPSCSRNTVLSHHFVAKTSRFQHISSHNTTISLICCYPPLPLFASATIQPQSISNPTSSPHFFFFKIKLTVT